MKNILDDPFFLGIQAAGFVHTCLGMEYKWKTQNLCGILSAVLKRKEVFGMNMDKKVYPAKNGTVCENPKERLTDGESLQKSTHSSRVRRRIYAVTGAFGHLGNTVVRALLKQGEKVRALALPGDTCPSLENRDPGKLEIFRGDVRDPEAMCAFFRKEEGDELFALHGAGIVTISSKVDPSVYDVNVNGTMNVVRAALEQKVDSFLYVSSVHALPVQKDLRVIEELSEPENFCPDLVEGGYAKTKAAATRIVLESVREGLPAKVVHPSGIIGPWDRNGGNHLMEMILSYLEGRLPACVRGGYDFVDVRDVAEGCISALENGRKGECYILSNRHYEMKEIIRMLAQISGKKRICPALPIKVAAMGVPFCEWNAKRRNRRPLFTGYSLRVLKSNDKFSHEKAGRELGYHPRDLYDTLEDTVKWMAASGKWKKAQNQVTA